MKYLTFPLLAIILSTAGGCAMLGGSKDTIHVVKRDGLDIHALPPGYTSIVTRDNASREKMCAGRMPDALTDKTVSLSLEGSAGLGGSIGSGSNEMALGGRSPDVLIIRETLFRLCELSLNQNLSPDASVALFREMFPLLMQSLRSNVPGSRASGSSSVLPSPAINQMQSPAPTFESPSFSGPPYGVGPNTPSAVTPGNNSTFP